MVFCGKPSKGCTSCRKRRIKCDLAAPACSQCVRSEQPCSGYRDLQALMFRNENAKVIRRARVPASRAGSASASGSTPSTPRAKKASLQYGQFLTPEPSPGPDPVEFDSDVVEEEAVTTLTDKRLVYVTSTAPDLPFCRLSSSIEDQGISFFFNNYMTFMSSTPSGLTDVFSSPLFQEVSSSKKVFDAVSSVGLAGLSNVNKDKKAMVVARRKYSETLVQIRDSLDNPDQTGLDYTLKAVVILAIFEIVNSTGATHDSWRVHINGAVALMRSGVLKKLKIKRSMRMQLQFCFSSLIDHCNRGEAFPPSMIKWAEDCRASQAPSDSPAAVLLDIAIRFANLNASLISKSIVSPHDIITSALQLERELDAWASTDVPPTLQYHVIEDDSPMFFRGRYHIYQDLWSAKTWNHYRWSRILINELLVTNIHALPLPLAASLHSQHEKSLALIRQLADEICSSVSSECCRHTVLHSTYTTVTPQMSGIFLVLFPITVAAGAVGVAEETHRWCLNTLSNIGNRMGILQAHNLVPMAVTARRRWLNSGLHLTPSMNMNVEANGSWGILTAADAELVLD
ncbi:hypothetical protein BP6252_12615 [Coleophoma cylindrospora]|uniref:Zn(2)-C6 fungal-type domain-containing protein n=1 Tax=Coleophoma cylindrospora TaxID=1849047 RepID=A0A3D8QD40_9HELO|nr:hypothetical protein BP6252_12615 [Coleophoma cylindrospora]